jgi:hypothetical protein
MLGNPPRIFGQTQPRYLSNAASNAVKTAKALGRTVPQALQASADQMVE